MKNIFLMAYARKNLGDDLFIKMILERYPDNNFYMMIDNYEYLTELDKFENLHVIKGKDTDEELYKFDVNEYDAYIYIGGSIFMEGGKVYNLSDKFYDFVKRCKDNKKPFCYVSCNYGPYQTQEYMELSKRNFKIATDVCFRDKYSYKLFNSIDSVRYAPDFAFTYKLNKTEKIPNSVGISIIDLTIRERLKHKDEQYTKLLINNINNYLQDNKKVYLYTFCNDENDERTLNKVLEKFESNQNVIDVRYDGNLDKFLDTYSRMEYMICARFHAMILSCVARQKMYVMSYSNKIDNVIDDLQLNLPTVHFDNIEENVNIDLKDFVSIDDNKIEKIIKESASQEKEIKKILLKS